MHVPFANCTLSFYAAVYEQINDDDDDDDDELSKAVEPLLRLSLAFSLVQFHCQPETERIANLPAEKSTS